MKRFAQSAFGVTLLEIMLVLAIASLIIVMSALNIINRQQMLNSRQMPSNKFQRLKVQWIA